MQRRLLSLLLLPLLMACEPEKASPPPKPPTQNKQPERPSPPINNAADFFPEYDAANVGLRRQFRATYDGKPERRDFTIEVHLADKVTIDGQLYVRYELTNKGFSSKDQTQVNYYRLTESGVEKRASPDKPATQEMSFPLKLAKAYDYKDANATGQVTPLGYETIQVDGQARKCLRLRYVMVYRKGNLLTRVFQTEYRARGLGMVKSIVRYDNGSMLTLEATGL